MPGTKFPIYEGKPQQRVGRSSAIRSEKPIVGAPVHDGGHFPAIRLGGRANGAAFLYRDRQAGPSGGPHRLLAATLLATLFGLLDEIHQFTNPERYFEWADLAADFLGALLASAAYLWIGPLQALLEVNFKGAGRLMFMRKGANSGE